MNAWKVRRATAEPRQRVHIRRATQCDWRKVAASFVESKLKSLSLKRAERRLLREYLDLPGLNLSLAQAARLVSVDAPTCEAALANLVKSHCLAKGEAETYVRGTCDGGLEAWKRLVRNAATLEAERTDR
jgi:hypothetical protein